VNAPEHRVKNTVEAAAQGADACVIFAQPAGAQYGWGWRCGAKGSKALFRYFYECVQDARKHGYAVDFAQVAESLKNTRSAQ
jgi:hypothetical protein